MADGLKPFQSSGSGMKFHPDFTHQSAISSRPLAAQQLLAKQHRLLSSWSMVRIHQGASSNTKGFQCFLGALSVNRYSACAKTCALKGLKL